MINQFKGFLLVTCMVTTSALAGTGVSVISANANGGAWIGYSDGAVQFCNGGGGTAVPFWTACAGALAANGSAVTDISNNDRRAWIGYANGQLHYCRDSGSSQKPVLECTGVKP